MGNPLVSRMQGFGTTIFAEMSALAARTGAINLGQGFPDTDGPRAMLDAAVAAIRGPQPVPARSGRPGAARGGRGAPAALLRARRRPRPRGAGDGRCHRGDRLRGARPVRAGRRGRHVRAVLRLLRCHDRAGRRGPAYRRCCASPTSPSTRSRCGRRSPPAPGWCCSTPRTTPPARSSRRAELELICRAGARSTTRGWSPTRSTSTSSSTAPSTCRSPPCPGWRSAPSPSPRPARRSRRPGGRSAGCTGPAEAVTAVRTVKQFLTYVASGPFQPAVAAALGLGDEVYAGLASLAAGQARPARARGCEAGGLQVTRPAGHLLRHRRRGAARGRPTRWPSAGACRRWPGSWVCRCRCSTTTSTRPARWCGSPSASGTRCCTRRSTGWPRSPRAEARSPGAAAHRGCRRGPTLHRGEHGAWRQEPDGHDRGAMNPLLPLVLVAPAAGDSPRDRRTAAAGSGHGVAAAPPGRGGCGRLPAGGRRRRDRAAGSRPSPPARCALPGDAAARAAVGGHRTAQPLDVAAVAPARGAPAVRRTRPNGGCRGTAASTWRARSARRCSVPAPARSPSRASSRAEGWSASGTPVACAPPTNRWTTGSLGGTPVARGARIGALAGHPGHCDPAACLHWGAVDGETYRDPLTLIDPGPPVLLPLR